MSQNTNAYNPIFYAQEALIQLEKALGMAGRIHRGYDEEHRAFGKGDTINIRRPSTFTAQNAPSAAQDLTPTTVQLTLNYWREVKFKLTDKELTLTTERIIQEHIRPAAYALADDVDQKLAALAFQVPWYFDLTGTAAVPVISDVTGPYKVLFNNNVPMGDETMLHYMVDGGLQQILQNLPSFNQVAQAGSSAEQLQMRGTLGRKFGMEIFANQNVQSKVAGTLADTAGAVATEGAVGATTLDCKNFNAAETLKVGDTFVIAGNTQRYALTADKTIAGGNTVTLAFTPPLVATASVDAVVTAETDAHVANLAFHRNFAALATAPLSEIGNQLGAKIATVTDPITALALRSRLFYDGANSAVYVALDILYGLTILDGNLGCRCRG